jgi:fatty-acyl-CoA synthase
MAMHAGLTADSAYLWTLPMFHCNGWCFTWAVTAAGAKHICLRSIDVAEIWRSLRADHVTHFSAAPTVLNMIAAAGADIIGPRLERTIEAQTGGAPPSPTLLATMADLNINVTHLYGLTETFGPIAINDWRSEWSSRTPAEQAALKARQGVGNIIAERLRVVADDGSDVPPDGSTVGEIVTRGNDVMLGYYRDPAATDAVSVEGWFRTGDLAVMHADGYVEIKDRSKDIIISGGENIASVEIERVIDAYPGVLESAVVARRDAKWGEVPVAFVSLRPGAEVSASELTDHVRRHLAHFKAPRDVVFGELPKTSTGKIQKGVLRTSMRS